MYNSRLQLPVIIATPVLLSQKLSKAFGYLLLITAVMSAYVTQAQCPNATVPSNFSTWNWEEQAFVNQANPSSGLRSAYCNTWQANIGTGSQVSPYSMGSPWIRPGSVGTQAIALAGDYRKADGWELVRFDFGARGSVPVPYFILYNKKTGVLRIFAYIVNTNPLTGVVFTLLHSGNNSISGHTAATRSLARPLIQAPDKYLSQDYAANASADQTSYVAFFSGSSSWTMGQFSMMLDPNINNSAFNLNSYQFQINGMIESQVTLDGAFQFKTGQFADSDFSFSGSKSAPTAIPNGTDPSVKQIITNTEKFLGDISSITTKISDIRDNAKKLSGKITATDGPLSDVKKQADKISTSGDALKSLGSVASNLGGILGLAGTFIGFLTDDGTTKPAFVPSYAKGTITMTGSIKTKTLLHSFFVLTPATSHSPSGSTLSTDPNAPIPPDASTQLSYYNCPQGIFNISNTLALQKIDYQRVTLAYARFDQQAGEGYENTSNQYRKSYTSYELLNNNYNLKPIVNAESGLEIKSVKVAIAQKVLAKDIESPYSVDYSFAAPSYQEFRYHNFLYAQINSGLLEVYPYDAGKTSDGSDAQVIVQTPFIEVSCLKSGASTLPFNIPTPGADRPVYLRLIAELHKIGTAVDSAPIYFAQDYAVDVVQSTNSYTVEQHLNTLPPFHVYYPFSYDQPSNLYAPNLIKTGSLTYTGGKISEISNRTLLFDQNSTVKIGSSYGTIGFEAAESVGIAGTLEAPSGAQFSITTGFQSIATPGSYSCSSSGPYDRTQSLPCYYDTRAARIATTLATTPPIGLNEQMLTLSPNPASTSVLAELKMIGVDCIQQVDLITVDGRTLWHNSYNCMHDLSVEIPLRNLPTGIYIVRVTTSSKVYTSKLAVE